MIRIKYYKNEKYFYTDYRLMRLLNNIAKKLKAQLLKKYDYYLVNDIL